jgi:hypothetical protein
MRGRIGNKFAEALVKAVASDRAGRRVSTLCRPDDFADAAEILAPLERVAVVSGFYVPKAGAPETDGPGGAAVLAMALRKMGKESRIWSDSLCIDSIRACADALGLPPEISQTASGSELLDEFCPDGVIFTERLGRAADGRYYNMASLDITEWTPPLDTIAFDCAERGIKSVGIGDGGNEVGMGKLGTELKELLPDYADCLSVVPVDAAISCDVSNWGAYALTAALSALAGKWCGHEPDGESAMLAALSDCGAVDGTTAESARSVDGFSEEVQRAIVSELFGLWRHFSS